MSAHPCYEYSSKHDGADRLRLELTPVCFYILAYHHLDLVKFESDKAGDVLTLSFLDRTARITGKNLRSLADNLQRRNIEAIKLLPDKYAGLAHNEVLVRTIEIKDETEQR